ncbi:DNA cytosine methyltransferase [Nostoc sp.]|uniref:DNA cytosine methyltransferase n=1 Tax=Nostoc sp. TaxID=1180 RepID=UPI002FFAD7C9
MNVIELFAGAAGLAQGFERSGNYQTLALYDKFEPAKNSYKSYRPNANYELIDINELRDEQIYKTLDGQRLDGILGGPPCQGFSLLGKRKQDDDINNLVLAYAKVVKEIKPSFLVMENVPQLLFHPLFYPLIKELSEYFYITYGILNAARYGTPQTRHRLFLIAYRRDYNKKPTFPQPTHGQEGQYIYSYHLNDSNELVVLNNETSHSVFGADLVINRKIAQQVEQVINTVTPKLEPLVTVGDAISDLVSSAGKTSLQKYTHEAQNLYQRALRQDSEYVANCIARQHSGERLSQLQNVREGGRLEVYDIQSSKKRYYSQAYGRLHRAGLARTLTTYFQNAGSGRFFHYSQPRTLTIREAARLQGFNDDFIFHGNLGEQMQLVGNAVPLHLAEAIGRHIHNELSFLIEN